MVYLGESWAYYMGHFMADLKYGAQSSSLYFQNDRVFSSSGSGSSHINAIENFDPNYANDPFRWIPIGVYQDLRDANNELAPVHDNVSGYYTNQIMFNAFCSSITTPQAYRANLLNQNTSIGSQATQVTALFTDYHY